MANFFDEHSPYLSHPLLTDERTRSEVDRLVTILELTPTATVLDVGCAFGRHSIEFARRGFATVGIDPSPSMIDAARANAGELPVRFATQLPASSHADSGSGASATSPTRFDGAIMMFTTLGQVDDRGVSNEAVLVDTAQCLHPGAGIVIEVPQRQPAIDALVTNDRFEVGSKTTVIERSYTEATRRVNERFVVTDDRERVFDLSYRLFDRDELAELLDAAGLVNVRFSGSLDGLVAGKALTGADASMLIAASAPS